MYRTRPSYRRHLQTRIQEPKTLRYRKAQPAPIKDTHRLNRAGRISNRRVSFMAVLLFLVIGIGLLVSGSLQLIKEQQDVMTYLKLRQEASATDTQNDGYSAELQILNTTDAVAWLTLSGTDIDYPVAQADLNNPNYYLTHNLWGEDSVAGCLYIDARTGIENYHTLIYGHRMGATGGMFSELRTSYNQNEFNELGTLYLTTKDGTKTYTPFCALEVDKANQEIQNFSQANTDDLKQWLKTILQESNARSANADRICSNAQQAVTLITCSQLRSGQRGRSAVLFVS